MTTTKAASPADPPTNGRPLPWERPDYQFVPPAVRAAAGKAIALADQLGAALDELARVVAENMPPASGKGFNMREAMDLIKTTTGGSWAAEQLAAAIRSHY